MSTTQRPEARVEISLTLDAADKVREFMVNENVAEDTASLRISVVPGGCSGFKYNLAIEENSLDDDLRVETEGIQVLVDPFSAQYLNATVINYLETTQGAGFSFENPNALGGCGCGSSFSA